MSESDTFPKRFYQDVVKLSFYKYYTSTAGVDHWKCNISIGAGIVEGLWWEEDDVISLNINPIPAVKLLTLFKNPGGDGYKLKKANKSYYYTIRFPWHVIESENRFTKDIKYSVLSIPYRTSLCGGPALNIDYGKYFVLRDLHP